MDLCCSYASTSSRFSSLTSDGIVPTQSGECSGEIVSMTLSRMASTLAGDSTNGSFGVWIDKFDSMLRHYRPSSAFRCASAKLGFKNPKHVVSLAVLHNYTGGYWEEPGIQLVQRPIDLSDPALQRWPPNGRESGHVKLVSLPQKSVYGYNAAGSLRVGCDTEPTTNAESSGRKRCLAPC